MSDTFDADLVDAARDSLEAWLVADTPDGNAYANDGEFPDDNTVVWIGTDRAATTTIGELFERHGDAVVLYAEPELSNPVDTVTTTTELVADDMVEDETVVAATEPEPVNADQETDVTVTEPSSAPRNRIGRITGIDGDNDGQTPDETDEIDAVTAAMGTVGAATTDELFGFLDNVAAALTPLVAAAENRAIPIADIRRAVGGSEIGQKQALEVFERIFSNQGIDAFVVEVIGERPADDAGDGHDALAWDDMNDEAQNWYRQRAAVTAALNAAKGII